MNRPQSGRFSNAVDFAEDAVLNRVGVLELVDQGHRVLLANGLRQARARRAFQGTAKAVEQVVETDLRPAQLFFLEGALHFTQSMQQQLRADVLLRLLMVDPSIDGSKRWVRTDGTAFVQLEAGLPAFANVATGFASLAPGGDIAKHLIKSFGVLVG